MQSESSLQLPTTFFFSHVGTMTKNGTVEICKLVGLLWLRLKKHCIATGVTFGKESPDIK